jgi:hypothetical protein
MPAWDALSFRNGFELTICRVTCYTMHPYYVANNVYYLIGCHVIEKLTIKILNYEDRGS